MHTSVLPVPLDPSNKKEWLAPDVSAVLLSKLNRFVYTSCNLGRISIVAAAILKVSSNLDLTYSVIVAKVCRFC